MLAKAVKRSQPVIDTICDRIADGKSLSQICKMAGMPNKTTFLRWVGADAAVREQYETAVAAREDRYFEQIIEIADSAADPSKTRVQVDARKWVLARMNPKKYGDRMTNELTGANGGPVQTSMTINFVHAKPKEPGDGSC